MLRIHVLGGLTLCRDGVPLAGAATQPRRLAVLGLLARSGARTTTRDKLIALIWPDASDEQGRRALTQALYALRRELGAEDVLVGTQDLRLNPDRVSVDLWEFEGALSGNDPERAVGCYAGPFLDGFRLPGADELERWIDVERRALEHRHAEALTTLARRAEAAGDLDAAVGWWRRRAACDPLETRVALQLMQALAAAGDHAAAVRQGRIHQALVEDQLGMPPDPAIEDLIERLQQVPSPRTQRPTSLRDDPPDPPLHPGDSIHPPDPPLRPNDPLVRPEDAAPRPGPALPVGRRRISRKGVAALALVAVLLAFAGAWAARARGDDQPVLVVGAIRQHGVHADSSLAAIVDDLLATGLGRTGAVQVISPGRAYSLARRLGRASDLEVAAAAGATQLIDGSIYRTPGGLRLDLRRIEVPSGRQLEALTIEGEDVFTLVDQGTDRLISGLGLAVDASDVAGVTTRSAVAYGFYTEGVRSYYQGDRRTAVRMLDAALSEDSGFAMAEYYRAFAEPEHRTEAGRRLERARRLASRATDRERLLIRAGWAGYHSSPELRAVAETLAVRYPHEVEGHYLTGLAQVQSAAYAGAVAPLERAIALDSLGLRGVYPVCHGCDALRLLSAAYLLMDSTAAAERVLHRWIAARPGAGAPYFLLTEIREIQERPAEALAAYGAAVSRGGVDQPEWIFLAQHMIRGGELRKADDLLRSQLGSASATGKVEALWFLTISLRQQGRLREALAAARRTRELQERIGAVWEAGGTRLLEAQVLLEMGDLRGALARFDSAAHLHAPDAPGSSRARARAWALAHAAGAYARLGDTTALVRLADELQALGARTAWSRDRRMHHYVRGLLWEARGNDREAAAEFGRALDSRTFGYTRINLEFGRLLLRQGKPREAAALLEAALRGSLESANLYVSRTELHELLARAWTAAREPEKARPHLRAVDVAWAAADPPYASRRARLLADVRGVERPSATSRADPARAHVW
jgi:DNA-binding SARP family transcriptional activator/TolB-like protein